MLDSGESMKSVFFKYLIKKKQSILNNEEKENEKDEAEKTNLYVQLAGITALRTLIEVLPRFISPHITTLLEVLLHSNFPHNTQLDVEETSLMILDDENPAKSIPLVLSSIFHTLSNEVECRVLLPSIFDSCYMILKNASHVHVCDKSLIPLFWLLELLINANTAQDLHEHYPEFVKFLLPCLEFRNMHEQKFESIALVENALIAAFLSLVIKLTEGHFKSLFLKLLDWLDITTFNPKDDLGKTLPRCIVFMKLLSVLIGKLKTLLVPYFGYLIEHCVLFLEYSPLNQERQPKKKAKDNEWK